MMKTSPIALFAFVTAVAIGTFAASGPQASASQFDLPSAGSYLECLKRARAAAETGNNHFDQAVFDRGRKDCNSAHLSSKPSAGG
jgi:hypothetical protein